ncbi:MAG: type II secretion system protein [Pirellulaceae bacterium]|nr:type II secretion system protein [Pirellulaceae bacterium]
MPRPLSHRQARRGFSLAESLVAISIMGLASSVLLLAAQGSLETTTDAVDRTIAAGMAQQLLDEVVGKHFMIPGGNPLDPGFSASAWERGGSGRERFNDTDDYHGISNKPAEGIWGEALGTGNDSGGQRHPGFKVPTNYFADWRQRVSVYFVSANNTSQRLTSGTSYFRCVEVNIERIDRDGSVQPLAQRKRVIAWVPPPTY